VWGLTQRYGGPPDLSHRSQSFCYVGCMETINFSQFMGSRVTTQLSYDVSCQIFSYVNPVDFSIELIQYRRLMSESFRMMTNIQ
jgi:hypothetical protein